MKDLREELLSKIGYKITTLINDDVLTNKVMSTIVIHLDEYELSNRNTEVGFHNDSNEQLLRLYAGVILTEGKSKSTVKGYVYLLKRFLRETQKNFTDIKTMDIRRWLAEKQLTTSLRTCENYRAYISAFYTWLFNEKYINENPVIQIKSIKYPKTKESELTDVEIDMLRMNCDTIRNRAILETLLSSGVRVEELCDINIKDIDFNNKSIIIKKGKGGKQRTVYINEIALVYLKKYLKTRTDEGEYLFRTKNKTRITTRAVNDVLKVIAEKANIENVHAHRFRRTLATSLSKKGMDVRSIQAILGHENINTTMGYICINEDSVQAEYRKYT